MKKAPLPFGREAIPKTDFISATIKGGSPIKITISYSQSSYTVIVINNYLNTTIFLVALYSPQSNL